MKAEGKALYGIAMLDDEENMIGSVMVMDFPSRAELDEWLKVEPYVVGKVWEKVEVFKARVPSIFYRDHTQSGLLPAEGKHCHPVTNPLGAN